MIVYHCTCIMQDGEHQSEDTTPQYTPEQLKLMSSQDVKYLNYKRSTEMKVSHPIIAHQYTI